MRLRVIDWCRTNIHDARFGTDKRHMPIDPAAWAFPGRPGEHVDVYDAERETEAERPGEQFDRARPSVPWSDSTQDAFTEPDFQEALASRLVVERYELAAESAGVPLMRWVIDILDAAAELELRDEAA
jgi:hypothetical protein